MPESVDDKAADRVKFLVAKEGAEVFIKIFNGSERLNDIFIVTAFADRLLFLDIRFVLDLTHDFLEHVLDGDQACNTAVLVNHDRHVVAVLTELPQKHIQSFAFRDGDEGAH